MEAGSFVIGTSYQYLMLHDNAEMVHEACFFALQFDSFVKFSLKFS